MGLKWESTIHVKNGFRKKLSATFRRLLRSLGGVDANSGYKRAAPLEPVLLGAIPGY